MIRTWLLETCDRCVTQEQAENAMKKLYGEKVKVTPLEETALGKLIENYAYEKRKLQECMQNIDHIMKQITFIFEGVRKNGET